MATKKESKIKETDSTKKRSIKNLGKVNRNIKNLQEHFGRFLWDLLGVGLISWGLLLFVGLVGISEGKVLFSIVEFVSIWVGWGIIVVIGLLLYGGIISLKHGRSTYKINWKTFIWVEISCFLSLAILSIIGGNSIISVEIGWWGGRIGWSLVRITHNLFGALIGNILIFLLWIFSIISSLKGSHWVRTH